MWRQDSDVLMCIFYPVFISVHVLLVQSSGTRPVVHCCGAQRTTIAPPFAS